MHYQEAVVWKKAMRLAELVCMSSAGLPAQERYGIRLQITRSAVSVAGNIAEGWTRESKRERSQFLAIAHGSLSELRTQLAFCEHISWLPSASLMEPMRLIDEISCMLTVLRRKKRTER